MKFLLNLLQSPFWIYECYIGTLQESKICFMRAFCWPECLDISIMATDRKHQVIVIGGGISGKCTQQFSLSCFFGGRGGGGKVVRVR